MDALLFTSTFIPPSITTYAEQAGWWYRSESMVAPLEGHMLTDKIMIVSVTYHGNGKSVKIPAEDNWTCIAQGVG